MEPIDIAQLVAEASLDHISLKDTDASGLHARNLSLDESLLDKVSLSEARLDKLSISDSLLRHCDLAAASCGESSLIRIHIIGGRMTGTDFSRSTLKDVTFEDCKLDMANFRFAKFKRVQFINCMMSETDFQGAELIEIAFQASHLERVMFDQCTIKSVDARTSQLFDIRGWQALRGLVVDSVQLTTIAPQLASELGLVIKD
jgi:uncharacterized protein YjbI with pentapeptide repeats